MRNMFRTNKSSASAQIDIKSIHHDFIELTENTFIQILSVGSINFELKSDSEQDAIIEIYQSFLNSLNFDIQILLRTRSMDIKEYLIGLNDSLNDEKDEIYATQINSYIKFIKQLVEKNKILTRQFYVVVPFKNTKKIDTQLISEQLDIRTDIIIKNLHKLGILSSKLNTLEILDLFYSFYSPSHHKIANLSNLNIDQYSSDFIKGVK